MIAHRAARALAQTLVTGIALALILCGCSGDDQPGSSASLPSAASSKAASSSSAPDQREKAEPVLSPLTGLEVDAEGYKANRRPVAVVVGNHGKDRPQRGLAEAEVVYEIMEKDGTTNLMALYSDRGSLPLVGPVTEAQDAFAQFAIGQNAVFAHISGTIYTENLLNELAYQDVDGIFLGRTAFVFDSARSLPRPGGKLNESCWFTDGRLIKKGMKKAGVKNTAEMSPLFHFTPDGPRPAKDAEQIKITFLAAKSGFLYNEDAGLYTKMLGKKAHTDDGGNTLTFNNVLLLECSSAEKEGDPHNLDYDLRGGKGYYFNAGNVQKITWRKGSPQDALQLFDNRGHELSVQAGTSYIGLLDQDVKLSYGRYKSEG